MPAAVGMVAGITLDGQFDVGLRAIAILGAAAVVVILAPPLRRTILPVLLAAAALGAAMHHRSFRTIDVNHIVNHVPADPVLADVRGEVISEPSGSRTEHFFSGWMHRSDSTRFLLRAIEIQAPGGAIPVSGTVMVYVNREIDALPVGATVSILGRLYRPTPPANPGQFDYQEWLARRGVRVGLSCRNPDLVTVESDGGGVRSFRERIRRWSRRMLIDPTLSAVDESTLLETLVLGRRRSVDREIEQRFTRTGTTHFLAVSGAHVGIVAGAAWLIGGWLFGSRRSAAILAAATIIYYAFIVDARPPVVRASIIGLTLCVAVMLRRAPSTFNMLSLAAIVLLCMQPTAVFDVGFQLSFAGTFGIAYLYRPFMTVIAETINRRTPSTENYDDPVPYVSPPRAMLHRIVTTIVQWTVVGLVAWAATAPIVGFHFGRIALLGFPFSLLLTPLFVLTVLVGFAALVAGSISPAFSIVAQPIARFTAGLLLDAVALLDSNSPQLHGFLALSLALVASLFVFHSGFSMRRCLSRIVQSNPDSVPLFPPLGTPKLRHWLALVVGIAVCLGISFAGKASTEELRVTHLAVGSGTAAVIEFPNGQTWLYDCGTNRSFDVGASAIVPFCRTRGSDRLDRVIISHANTDHFSGFFSVADALPVAEIVVNGWFDAFAYRGGASWALLDESRRRNIPVQIWNEPFTQNVGQVELEFLHPAASQSKPPSANDASTVLRLSTWGHSILFTGDVEYSGIETLLRTKRIASSVLVLPHHGGAERNIARLVESVAPTVCICSTSRRADKLPRITQAAIKNRTLFSTADDGAVTVVISPTALTIEGYASHRSTLIPRED